MAKDQTNPGMSVDEQLKVLELEERRQALESRKIQDELARLQLTGLKAELETKKGNKERGAADAKKAIDDLRAMQDRCNHRTGGKGALAITQGQGDTNRPTCIGAQVFLDDRIRLVCGRCRAECWSNDPDRQKWAYWVGLWKASINQEMMVVGGLKQARQPQMIVA
jgi:hypothetical protein